MERRRCTNRRAALETVIASLFWIRQFNVIPDTESDTKCGVPTNAINQVQRVNGPKVSEAALIGRWNCANPVQRVLGFGTESRISDCEILLGILSAAVNRKQLAVLAFLERAELRDGDSWYRSDYRLAAQIATLASEGHPDPYTQAFVTTYGKHPSKVVGWWRDREKLLRIAEQGNCATPLLLANQAQELLERPAIIPDYDPTVSPVLPNPGVEPKPAKAPARATTSSGGRAGDSRKGSAA